jgi:hypothetical protein
MAEREQPKNQERGVKDDYLGDCPELLEDAPLTRWFSTCFISLDVCRVGSDTRLILKLHDIISLANILRLGSIWPA